MDSLRNGRGIWNVRATPRWQIASGVSPPIDSPRNVSVPSVGASAPEMQLNAVVFPDPFGPISPRISPSRTSNDTALSAVNPPNRLVRLPTASIAAAGGLSPPARVRSACCKWGRGGQRQDRAGRLHRLRVHDLALSLDDLEHAGERALVLARHRI